MERNKTFKVFEKYTKRELDIIKESARRNTTPNGKILIDQDVYFRMFDLLHNRMIISLIDNLKELNTLLTSATQK